MPLAEAVEVAVTLKLALFGSAAERVPGRMPAPLLGRAVAVSTWPRSRSGRAGPPDSYRAQRRMADFDPRLTFDSFVV